MNQPVNLSTSKNFTIDTLRHSTAHILAQAVLRLYPDAKLGIGPAIPEGFYYDFDLDHSLTPEDLKAIEAEMKKIVKENLPFIRTEVSREEAISRMQEAGQPYKVELLNELPDDVVTLYANSEFSDLCRGPHIESTGQVRAFTVLKVAGAYWRGNEKNKMLQRVYGTAFFTKEELQKHLHILEEARKRDHRKLGKELDLFSFHEEGPGFVFWHPKGMVLYNRVIDYWKRIHDKYGYSEVKTPTILHERLWHQSGHWDNYRENMYFVAIDEQAYAVKPMNCPGGILIYKETGHSYRELPIKMAELGLVHRHERSGVLQGLFRVRQFTQDDAHVFCTPEQIEVEIARIMELVEEIYSTFGFSYEIELSTRPEKSTGSDEMWAQAEKALDSALRARNVQFAVNEGDGAFYGPKIDFHIKDALGRSWQCGTIQLDFSMPERFELTYVGPDGNKHRPVMIHRAILGSIERFIGILIEHYAGLFPFWLAPMQVAVLPIGDQHISYAQDLAVALRESGITVKVDDRNEKIGYKIREAEMQRIPYMLVIGDKELESGTVAVRSKKAGSQEVMERRAAIEKLSLESRTEASCG